MCISFSRKKNFFGIRAKTNPKKNDRERSKSREGGTKITRASRAGRTEARSDADRHQRHVVGRETGGKGSEEACGEHPPDRP